MLHYLIKKHRFWEEAVCYPVRLFGGNPPAFYKDTSPLYFVSNRE